MLIRFSTDPAVEPTKSPSRIRRIAISALTFVICVVTQKAVHAQNGTWTQLTTQNPNGGTGVMILLTDGTVMAQGPNVTNFWNKLTPDSQGNYISGTWSNIASMSTQRLFFASNMLPTGKVFVLGGEYSGANGDQNITNTGEIYDPATNRWTTIATFPQGEFGDDPSVVLPNGKILCGYIFDARTYLYDPTNDSWTQTGTKLRGDASDEELWLALPGGNVLSYDVFASSDFNQGHAQRYNYLTGRWTDAGNVPVILSSSALGFELGPGALLPDGRAIVIGANNLTAIYTPGTNTWIAGPTLPANMGCDDAPGAMLPNGHFIFIADTSSPVIFTAPSKLYDYSYLTNMITDITPAGGLNGLFTTSDAFPFRLLLLPNGHMLLGHRDTAVMWDYNPTGAPLTAWRPTISSVTKNTGVNSTTYTLTGTQLTGISEGATYGDDVEMSTNYPIVKLVNSAGKAFYAKTFNWTPGIATGSARVTTEFTLPTGLANGIYQLSVSANGISSASQTFQVGATVTPSNVTAVYNSGTKTLTLVGDANANSLTVSLQAGVLTVEGANGTKINSTTQFATAHTGQLVLAATLNDGDDAMSVIGVSSSTSTISLGNGNDTAAFTLCNIATLTIDGGAGVDALLTTSSTVGKLHETNIP